MISTKLASIGLAAVLFAVLPVVQAQAQAIRTFVSVAGDDSNPCTITQPCRHFQAAVNATSVGGEVDALDPGAYGSFTISHAITIEGQGWSYVAPPANGIGILLSAVSGKVYIHGVSLNGVGATGNTNGIVFNSGSGTLTVRDSVIRNFNGTGILFTPFTPNVSRLYVSNTLVSENGFDGIDIYPTGSGNTIGVLDHVQMVDNGITGLNVGFGNSIAQAINVTVSDSVIANNNNGGMLALSSNAIPVAAMVRNSTIANNGNDIGGDGLEASGNGATIRVTRSTITGNSTGWLSNAGGVVLSYGDNNIDGNTNVNSEPPNPLGYH